ncbi:uncharacterized protein F5147DRAFT_705303 [Suillus discolor]|uniref:Secreted protein n=1 Tax=Suillus discolor TaxID=1912936 RepID=A0A9P7F3S5_9AGAM|nr:uncharacterized protein F5147DRAFT_705303 [Suillus discolor]KAG2103750.1 hypothetical protein F5147DRAFT_705303 [Suillus discolor]
MFGALMQTLVLLIHCAQYRVCLQPPTSKRSVLSLDHGHNQQCFTEHSHRVTNVLQQTSLRAPATAAKWPCHVTQSPILSLLYFLAPDCLFDGSIEL